MTSSRAFREKAKLWLLEHNSNIGVVKHLERQFPSLKEEIIQELGEFTYGTVTLFFHGASVCRFCGRGLPANFFKPRQYCNSKCRGQCPELKARTKATTIARYGVSTPLQNAEVRAKADATLITKFGGHHMSNAKFVADMQARSVNAHGVAFAVQRPEIHERVMAGRYRIKTLELDGKQFKCQGYEPDALRILHKVGVPATRLSSFRVHGFKHGKRVYFPDLMVKSWTGEKEDRLYVEVKGLYTAGMTEGGDIKNERAFNDLTRKARALVGKAYYLLMVIDRGKLAAFCFGTPTHERILTSFNAGVKANMRELPKYLLP